MVVRRRKQKSRLQEGCARTSCRNGSKRLKAGVPMTGWGLDEFAVSYELSLLFFLFDEFTTAKEGGMSAFEGWFSKKHTLGNSKPFDEIGYMHATAPSPKLELRSVGASWWD